jgi:hypothetical protein
MYFPDISWVFSRGGFHRDRDVCVRWEVQIRNFGDELRVGFTDDRASLQHRRQMTFSEEHAFILSDGSLVRGVFAAGRRISRGASFRPGDVVGCCLDFDGDSAAWFVNGTEVCKMQGLPDAELFAAVALDDEGDEVRLAPVADAEHFLRLGDRDEDSGSEGRAPGHWAWNVNDSDPDASESGSCTTWGCSRAM